MKKLNKEKILSAIKKYWIKVKIFFNNFIKHVDKFYEPPKQKITPLQEKIYILSKKLITLQDSILLIAPITSAFYVENGIVSLYFKDNDFYVKDNQYSYYVYMPEYEAKEIIKLFHRIMEKNTNKITSTYNDNSLQNLDKLINTI